LLRRERSDSKDISGKVEEKPMMSPRVEDLPCSSGCNVEGRSPIIERALAAGTISAAVNAEWSLRRESPTGPPPPREAHQQGTVEQVRTDTPIPPAKTWFVPGFAAAASRGWISWICGSEAFKTNWSMSSWQAGRSASVASTVVQPWNNQRRLDWRIDWCCVFVAEQQNRKQFVWLACSSTGLSHNGCPDYEQTGRAEHSELQTDWDCYPFEEETQANRHTQTSWFEQHQGFSSQALLNLC